MGNAQLLRAWRTDVVASSEETARAFLASPFGGSLEDARYRVTGDGDLAVPGHAPLLDRFRRRVADDAPVPVTPEQGTRVVEVIETVRDAV